MPKLDTIKKKIFTRETLFKQVNMWRLKNDRIVFTNGCFDLLHLGHVEYLAKAADQGTRLIVAVNSDDSVKRLGKSPNRPLQDETSRATIIASLHVTDAVIIFNEDTPYELISLLKPDVLAKGADYDASVTDPKDKKYVVGSDIVRANGGEVKLIELSEGYSTTSIEKKIKAS